MAKQQFDLWISDTGFGDDGYSITTVGVDMTTSSTEYALVGVIEIDIDHADAANKLQKQKRLNKAKKRAELQQKLDDLENEL